MDRLEFCIREAPNLSLRIHIHSKCCPKYLIQLIKEHSEGFIKGASISLGHSYQPVATALERQKPVDP